MHLSAALLYILAQLPFAQAGIEMVPIYAPSHESSEHSCNGLLTANDTLLKPEGLPAPVAMNAGERMVWTDALLARGESSYGEFLRYRAEGLTEEANAILFKRAWTWVPPIVRQYADKLLVDKNGIM